MPLPRPAKLKFQARIVMARPEGEEEEHEWTRTNYGARSSTGRHGAFHERV
jgi:hypothetical protein